MVKFFPEIPRDSYNPIERKILSWWLVFSGYPPEAVTEFFQGADALREEIKAMEKQGHSELTGKLETAKQDHLLDEFFDTEKQ